MHIVYSVSSYCVNVAVLIALMLRYTIAIICVDTMKYKFVSLSSNPSPFYYILCIDLFGVSALFKPNSRELLSLQKMYSFFIVSCSHSLFLRSHSSPQKRFLLHNFPTRFQSVTPCSASYARSVLRQLYWPVCKNSQLQNRYRHRGELVSEWQL